jgi:hypothetical protein
MTTTSEPTDQSDFVQRLSAEHRELQACLAALLDRPEDAEATQAVTTLWRRHNALETEAIQAVAMANADNTEMRAPLMAAQILQDIVTVLVETLDSGDPADRLAKRQALAQVVTMAMQQEEAPGAGLYARLATAGVDDLDARVARRADELTNEAIDAGTPTLHVLDLTAFAQQPRTKSETSTMARQSNTRERDENGRFVSDDDRRGGNGGSYARRRDDDRDDDRGGNGNGNGNGRGWSGDPRGHAEASRRGWETRRHEDDDRRSFASSSRSRYDDGDDRRRDDRGRFMSDDDRGSYGSRSRRDDDDDGRGWYGDSRGHAEASRRGWETRRGDDDDDRRSSSSSRSHSSSSSRYDDDDDRRRDDRGRFLSDDDRRSTSSSRSRRDDDDDDGRGWHGDSRGHAEAARRGWETRRGDDEDDRRSSSSRSRSSSSSRYDDDDRQRDDRGRFMSDDDRGGARSASSRRNDDDDRRSTSSSRSRRDDDDDDGRGWYGDPRGHAEAARRGWETRRN